MGYVTLEKQMRSVFSNLKKGKKMKKVWCVLGILMLVGLNGCGSEKPDNTVESAIECLKENQLNDASQYFFYEEDATLNTEEDEQSSETIDTYSSAYLNIMTTCAEENSQYLEYEILENTIDGDDATVKVQITYKNAGPVLKLAVNDLLETVVSSAVTSELLGGGDVDDDDMSAILLAAFEKEKENAAIIDKTETLDIFCKKTDNGWKITNYEVLLNVYYCNIYNTLDNMFDSEEDTEEIVDNNEEEQDENNNSDSDIMYYKDNDMRETTMSFVYWDDESEITIDLTYIGDKSSGESIGDFEIKMSYYDYDTDQNDVTDEKGTFIENPDGNGTITLENGNTIDYSMYWSDDHYVLYIESDGTSMELLEEQWAYNNVG